MSFHLPVYVGDLVSCYCRTVRVGQTSIRIHVETWARRREAVEEIKVTEGVFTYVAVDELGRKRPIHR